MLLATFFVQPDPSAADAKTSVVLTGRALMSTGVAVIVPERNTSEVLWIEGEGRDTA